MKDSKERPVTNDMSLKDGEKERLKSKILKSVYKHNLKKQRIRYAVGIAASVSILMVLSIYFYQTPSTTITDFAEHLPKMHNSDSDQVVLMLGEGKTVKLNEKIASINYSNTGKEVLVGNAKEVKQKVSENNSVVYNTLIVPYGKRSKIKLSDGSTVWLNSGSRIVYPAVFNGNKREVYLEGEAIFDVTHDKSKPFMVISKDQEIEVLGTEFGVSNYLEENLVNTVLKRGSVQITYHNNPASSMPTDKVKITPGTIASYNKKTKSIISEKVNVDNYFSWRRGVFIFKNNDLQFIAKRLSRYYNVKITLSNEVLKEETFSGYLNLNEDLGRVLENIKESTNIDYDIKNDNIIIKQLN